MKKESSSWDPYSKWYDSLVGEKGHFFHRELILPCLHKLFGFEEDSSLLDLGCGQGFLAGEIPEKVHYVGVDIGKDLLALAKKHHPKKIFYEQDLSQPLHLKERFSHAIFLLSLQNMPNLEIAIANAARHITPNGHLFLVLNHPCFRIPRQSSTEITPDAQYRKINLYHSSMKIPIQMYPGTTFSFHHPLQDYFSALKKNSVVVEELEELYSTKTSVGKKAKMENRMREEFPYFLVIKGKKCVESLAT